MSSSAFITYTMGRSSKRGTRECLAWRDLEFAPWLLGYEVLRDVEAHWPKRVEKERMGVRWDKEKFSAKMMWGAADSMLSFFLSFFSSGCMWLVSCSHRGTKVDEFSYSATIAKKNKKITPAPGRPKVQHNASHTTYGTNT